MQKLKSIAHVCVPFRFSAATFAKIWNTLNGIDVVINNAGILNDCKWEQTIGVNVVSTILLQDSKEKTCRYITREATRGISNTDSFE